MLRAIALLALLGGCATIPPTPTVAPTSTPTVAPTAIAEQARSRQRIVNGVDIVTGVDNNHTLVTTPLVETFPIVPADAAELTVSVINPVLVSFEGTVYFLQAATAEHPTVVLDRIIDAQGDTQKLPAGEYMLAAYYRGCDGNCGLLDPPGTICRIGAVFDPERAYELVVDMKSGICTLA